MKPGDEAPAKVLHTPFDEETVRSLVLGDTCVIDGIVWGIRDATLIRIFDQHQPPPADLTGAAILHVAPSVRRREDGGYDPISVGTTTSARMDRFTSGCLRELGVRAIIGKGGLSDASLQQFQQVGGVYLSIVGGAASLETTQVEAIEAVYWEDLMPECLWKFRVKDFGPLFVTMDSHGRSTYSDVRAQAGRNLEKAYQRLGIRSPG